MEDERLTVILRDYVPLERELPGVRTSSMRQPWPNSTKKPSFASSKASSSNNGGDYVTHRRSLLRSYAAAWLLALHDLDAGFYGETCFELVHEIAEEPLEADPSEMASDLNLFVVLLIESFQDGSIAATHHQAMSSIRRLHHI